MSGINFTTYKPKVGDEICVVKTTGTLHADAPTVSLTKVSFVGSKYFNIEAYPSYKFHINGKHIHKDASAFPFNYKLYPSKNAYNEHVESVRLLDLISKGLPRNEDAIKEVSVSDLKKVCELLNINIA